MHDRAEEKDVTYGSSDPPGSRAQDPPDYEKVATIGRNSNGDCYSEFHVENVTTDELAKMLGTFLGHATTFAVMAGVNATDFLDELLRVVKVYALATCDQGLADSDQVRFYRARSSE